MSLRNITKKSLPCHSGCHIGIQRDNILKRDWIASFYIEPIILQLLRPSCWSTQLGFESLKARVIPCIPKAVAWRRTLSGTYRCVVGQVYIISPESNSAKWWSSWNCSQNSKLIDPIIKLIELIDITKRSTPGNKPRTFGLTLEPSGLSCVKEERGRD